MIHDFLSYDNIEILPVAEFLKVAPRVTGFQQLLDQVTNSYKYLLESTDANEKIFGGYDAENRTFYESLHPEVMFADLDYTGEGLVEGSAAIMRLHEEDWILAAEIVPENPKVEGLGFHFRFYYTLGDGNYTTKYVSLEPPYQNAAIYKRKIEWVINEFLKQGIHMSPGPFFAQFPDYMKVFEYARDHKIIGQWRETIL